MNYQTNATAPARIARSIIEQYRPELTDLKICYMWRPEAMSMGEGRVVAGQCIHVDDRNWAIHGYDFIILFALDVWNRAEKGWHEAIVDHELAHCGIRTDEDGEVIADEDSGRTKTYCRHHDIEEFGEVLERHGAYHSDLRKFLAAWGHQ